MQTCLPALPVIPTDEASTGCPDRWPWAALPHQEPWGGTMQGIWYSVLPKQHLGARLPRRPKSCRSHLQCWQKQKCLGYSSVLSSKQRPNQISAETPRQGTSPAAVAKETRAEKCLLIVITTRAFQFGTVKRTGLWFLQKEKSHFLARQPPLRSPLG